MYCEAPDDACANPRSGRRRFAGFASLVRVRGQDYLLTAAHLVMGGGGLRAEGFEIPAHWSGAYVSPERDLALVPLLGAGARPEPLAIYSGGRLAVRPERPAQIPASVGAFTSATETRPRLFVGRDFAQSFQENARLLGLLPLGMPSFGFEYRLGVSLRPGMSGAPLIANGQTAFSGDAADEGLRIVGIASRFQPKLGDSYYARVDVELEDLLDARRPVGGARWMLYRGQLGLRLGSSVSELPGFQKPTGNGISIDAGSGGEAALYLPGLSQNMRRILAFRATPSAICARAANPDVDLPPRPLILAASVQSYFHLEKEKHCFTSIEPLYAETPIADIWEVPPMGKLSVTIHVRRHRPLLERPRRLTIQLGPALSLGELFSRQNYEANRFPFAAIRECECTVDLRALLFDGATTDYVRAEQRFDLATGRILKRPAGDPSSAPAWLGAALSPSLHSRALWQSDPRSPYQVDAPYRQVVPKRGD